MDLALTPELSTLIEQRVRSGRYAAAALYSLCQAEQFDELDAGELDGLLAEGESSGEALDGRGVLDELRSLRSGHSGSGR